MALRVLFGKIRDHDIGARAHEGGQYLVNCALAVEPTVVELRR